MSKVSNVICECCIPSCKEVGKADKTVDLRVAGWKTIKVSHFWDLRTHVGWCPKCAQKYRVVEGK